MVFTHRRRSPARPGRRSFQSPSVPAKHSFPIPQYESWCQAFRRRGNVCRKKLLADFFCYGGGPAIAALRQTKNLRFFLREFRSWIFDLRGNPRHLFPTSSIPATSVSIPPGGEEDPATPGFVQWMQTIGQLNIGLASAWRKAAIREDCRPAHCGHSNAPVEYAMKKRKKKMGRGEVQQTRLPFPRVSCGMREIPAIIPIPVQLFISDESGMIRIDVLSLFWPCLRYALPQVSV